MLNNGIYDNQNILFPGGAGAIWSNLSQSLAGASAAKVNFLDDLPAS